MNDGKDCDLPQNGLWRALDKVLSITCAGDPCQRCFLGTLGAQVNDRKDCDLPQNGVWRDLGKVLSITCAGDPLQKYL